VDASLVAMVTANPTFGDVEVSASLGMTPYVIRNDDKLPNIKALALLLEPK
jgi:hypothetical protein